MNFKIRLPLLRCAVLCCASSLSFPTMASDDAMMDLLKVLRDKGTISEQDYQALQNAAQEETAAAATKQSPGLVLDTGSSGLKLKSADGAFKFQVGGRVMVDAAYYDEDKTELGSGAEIRRARLFAAGTVYDDWFYKAQVDFENPTDGDIVHANTFRQCMISLNGDYQLLKKGRVNVSGWK